jgi:hypothetical protein
MVWPTSPAPWRAAGACRGRWILGPVAARRARDAWLRSDKANRLKVAGFTASTAGALIGLFAAPVAITIALAAGVLALAGGVAKDLPDVIDAFRRTQPDLGPMTFFLMEPSGG